MKRHNIWISHPLPLRYTRRTLLSPHPSSPSCPGYAPPLLDKYAPSQHSQHQIQLRLIVFSPSVRGWKKERLSAEPVVLVCIRGIILVCTSSIQESRRKTRKVCANTCMCVCVCIMKIKATEPRLKTSILRLHIRNSGLTLALILAGNCFEIFSLEFYSHLCFCF